ncbi:MAG: hypothetical protein E7031_03200 [Akkermansiaceae bacterium]|nr:hypothetical protein [Akkermansiaceae bacterium]
MADKAVEEHNSFSRWDSVGAAALLGGFPAVISILFNDFDIKGALLWAAVAVGAAGGVFLLSLVFNERFLSRIVNLAGIVLTVVYIVWACNVLQADMAKLGEDPALQKAKEEQKTTTEEE